ncbi:hypothetical protein L1887_15068 [Cichorium endivia]|nr:hypothetical protein L1887_15068 [Cichorium endivia]
MEDCCYGWRWRAAGMDGNGGLLLWLEMELPTFAVAGDGGLHDMRLFTSGETWTVNVAGLEFKLLAGWSLVNVENVTLH